MKEELNVDSEKTLDVMNHSKCLVWRTIKRGYSQVEAGYLGKIAVFWVVWDGLTSKNDTKKWKLSWTLPIKINGSIIKHFVSIEEAKDYVPLVLKEWFDKTGTSLYGR